MVEFLYDDRSFVFNDDFEFPVDENGYDCYTPPIDDDDDSDSDLSDWNLSTIYEEDDFDSVDGVIEDEIDLDLEKLEA